MTSERLQAIYGIKMGVIRHPESDQLLSYVV
jgi:hypothetical protein